MIRSELCTGCGACSLICPKGSIAMKVNDLGFYAASIDKSKCNECNLCEKVCINCYRISNGENFQNEENELSEFAKEGLFMSYSKSYDISSDNYVNKKSSSGGIAYEISKYFNEHLSKAVCGVVYNRQKKIAENVVVRPRNSEAIERLSGSKYLQSHTKEAFNEILKLDGGVVIGTPCQIYGLHRILKMKKKRDEFLLIDMFCYGVPSNNLLTSYFKYLKKRHKIEENPEVIFRTNKLGWHTRQIKVGQNYQNTENKDLFYIMFCKEYLCLNESCYACPFRRTTVSDIKLGDFWGPKYKNSKQGRSIVAVNTKRGMQAIEKIIDKIVLKKEESNDILISQGYDNPKKHPEYDKILDCLKNGVTPDSLISKYTDRNSLRGGLKRLKRAIMSHLNF